MSILSSTHTGKHTPLTEEYIESKGYIKASKTNTFWEQWKCGDRIDVWRKRDARIFFVSLNSVEMDSYRGAYIGTGNRAKNFYLDTIADFDEFFNAIGPSPKVLSSDNIYKEEWQKFYKSLYDYEHTHEHA